MTIDKKAFTIPVILFICFVILYGLTTYPGPGGRVNYNDSTWKALLPLDSKIIPHETGFPLYLYLTKIFYWLMPFKALHTKITAMSIFFGALTVVMVYLLSLTLSKNKTGSFLAALIAGLSFTHWTQATEAEIYALNAFLTVLTAFLFTRFFQTEENKFLLWGNLVYALSFGNHLTVIWMLPALVYIVLKTNKKVFLDKKIILTTLGFILLGMLPYLMLHLRFRAINQTSLSLFFNYITGGEWKSMAMFKFGLFEIFQQRMELFLTLWNRQFFLPGILAALLGLGFVLFKSNDREKIPYIFLSLLVLFQLFFCVNYGIHDINVYFIPIYALLAVFIAALFTERTFFKGKAALVLLVILLQLGFNLGRGDIHVEKNERLDNMMFLLENTPPGSLVLLPMTFERNGDYKLLARYISYTGEYGNYKVIYQDSDLRVPYYIVPNKGKKHYYMTSRLDEMLKKLEQKGKKKFYFIGSKNKRVLERNPDFKVEGKLYGPNRWMGLATRIPQPEKKPAAAQSPEPVK